VILRTTYQQVEEFISLWIRIQQVHLMPGTPNTIIWRWTSSGAYSSRSAYRIQFSGSYRAFKGDLIWRTHTKNKCKVFAWVMAREKVLTADNLQKKGWLHQEHCILCNGPLETCLHLALLCPFTRLVWEQILKWENFDTGQVLPATDSAHLLTWWEEAQSRIAKNDRRRFNGLVIYTIWNVRKERSMRIFSNSPKTALQVASRTKENILQWRRAQTWSV
jgi:hypothetical protein